MTRVEMLTAIVDALQRNTNLVILLRAACVDSLQTMGDEQLAAIMETLDLTAPDGFG